MLFILRIREMKKNCTKGIHVLGLNGFMLLYHLMRSGTDADFGCLYFISDKLSRELAKALIQKHKEVNLGTPGASSTIPGNSTMGRLLSKISYAIII
ncbi:hypothetical protein ACJX0J_024605, partial [Zea mays]